MAGGWSMRWTPHGTAHCLSYDEHTPTLIVRDTDGVVFSILPRLMDEVTLGELAAAESLHTALGEFIEACRGWVAPPSAPAVGGAA
jgi:hypothetical protein